jgi:sugar lactone lactonase YvrE
MRTLIFLLLTPFIVNAQVINTIAGNGTPGYLGDGGPATAAALYGPDGLATDLAGNIYISDWSNHCIRRISVAGIITTIAGNGTPGYTGDGGPATAANIDQPGQLFVDPLDNLFFADAATHCIRKINSSGIISTIAGNGLAGFSGDGGPATSARFNMPTALAFDGTGNLFVADFMNNRVRKITTAGIISTYAGTGAGGFSGDGGMANVAKLYRPNYLITDGANNLFVTDNANHRIRKITPSGIISTFLGNGIPAFAGDGGPATAASIDYPGGIAFDSAGNFYVADYYNHRIRKVNTSNVVSTVAGTGTPGYSGDGGPAIAARLNYPVDVAFTNAGNMMIADYNNNRVRMFGAFILPPANHIPTFTAGISDSLIICQNEVPVSINTLLEINDANAGQPETWSLATAPAHGLAIVSYTTTSTGGSIMPSGLTYMPTGGFSGFDAFAVKISDGIDSSIIIVNVNVENLPNAGSISGTDTVCPGAIITLAETMVNGHWTSTSVSVATVDSMATVYGISPGPDTIIYTVTNSCGTVSAIFPITVGSYIKCHTSVNILAAYESGLALFPNPVSSCITVSSQSKITQVVVSSLLGQVILTGNYKSERTEVDIDVTNLAKGIYFIKVNGASVRKFVKD